MKGQREKGFGKGNRVIKNGKNLAGGMKIARGAAKRSHPLQALLAAVKAPPHVKPEDVEEWERAIAAGKMRVSYRSPLKRKRRARRGT